MRIPAAAALLAALALPPRSPPAATAARRAPRRGPASVRPGSNAQIVAGGFVDGIVFSPAERGLAYARTDIGGAYRWDAAARRWVPLIDFTGFSDWNELGRRVDRRRPAQPRPGLGRGRRVHPAVRASRRTARSSAPPTRAAAGRPAPCRSSWPPTRTAATWASGSPSTPRDDAVLYLATPANGLWRSTDGGADWAQVASFPVTSTPDDIGLSFVTFDRPRPGWPADKTIFVGDATGKDLYESTDAGATWRLVPGQPDGHDAAARRARLRRHPVPGLRQPARAERDDRRQRVEVRHGHRHLD